MPLDQDTDTDLAEAYPFPRVIDNTMYERWKSCPHSFFRADIQGLRLAERGVPGEPPTIRKSIHLHFGAVLAAGLEETRRHWYAYHQELDALHAGAQVILKLWHQETNLPDPRTRTEEAKSLDNCLLAHAGYFVEWPLDDERQQVFLVRGEPMVELSGARPIEGTRHPQTGEPIGYAGRFDAILNRQGQPWGLDDKTTGASVEGESWPKQWKLRGQFTGYCWLAQVWGHNVEWFLIHGIQVLKTRCNYAEAVEIRPRWMVERWLAQLTADVNTMISQYEAFMRELPSPLNMQLHPPHWFGQNYGHACYDYNSPCQFQTLCSEPRPDLFYDDYIVDRWDPLAQRGVVSAEA